MTASYRGSMLEQRVCIASGLESPLAADEREVVPEPDSNMTAAPRQEPTV